jgi:hypothetical protein
MLDVLLKSHDMRPPDRTPITVSGQPAPKELLSEVRLSEILKFPIAETVRTVLERATVHTPRSGDHAGEVRLNEIVREFVRRGAERDAATGADPTTTPVLLFRWLKAELSTKILDSAFLQDPPAAISGSALRPDEVVLSNPAWEVVTNARLIARETLRSERIRTRDLLAALLTPIEGTSVAERVRGLYGERLGIDLWKFGPHLLAYLESNPASGEDLDAWRRLLAPILGNKSRDSIRYYTTYGTDVAASDIPDSLGITPDVQAFAELICLKKALPPLSIGLFGDWGSGKSFFMEKLALAVDDLTQSEKGRGQSPFVSRVIQIRFNAWHYADADLWASLTAEFFNQLRAGGYHQKEEGTYRGLVDAVARRVARAEEQAAALSTQAATSKGQIEQANEEIENLKKRRHSAALDVSKELFVVNARMFFENHTHDLRRIGDAIGVEDLPTNFETFLREVHRASSSLGKWKLAWRTAKGSWIVRLCLGVMCAVAIVSATLHLLLPDLLSRMLAIGGPLLGTISPFGVALWSLMRIMKPIFEATASFGQDAARFADEVEKRQSHIDSEIATKREQVAQLEAQARQVEQRRERQTAFVARYSDAAIGESRSALLHFFLHESEETKGYEKHLGLVSRVRRAFETLDAIMREKRTGPGSHAGLPDVDRIVLYVDDLDRCRETQVVKILEAVHLLLAFDLFVVIVGVDARWLQQSLAKHYRGQLARSNDQQEVRGTVTDYLEKIFQIPFWLRRLSYGQESGSGTYEQFIDSLVASDRAGNSDTTATLQRPRAEDAVLRDDTLETASASLGEPKGTTNLIESVNPLQAPVPLPISGRRGQEERKAVELLPDEITLMKELGLLVGKSPRAVKRFVNIYRLIRARRFGEDLDRFVGQVGQAREFATVMFLLALETGLQSTQAEAFYSLIDKSIRTTPALWDASVVSVLDPGEHFLGQPSLAVSSLGDPLRIKRGLQAVKKANGRDLHVRDLANVAAEVARYSFRQQRVQLPSERPAVKT